MDAVGTRYNVTICYFVLVLKSLQVFINSHTAVCIILY